MTTLEVLKNKVFLGILLLVASCMACGNASDEVQAQVRSHVSGQITLSADVDSTGDHTGFQVLVAEQLPGRIDTLGFGETNAEGQFAFDVVAPRRDIFSLVIGRQGSVLRVDEIVVAPDDSASFRMEFPYGANRPVMLRSPENAALLGFKNTIAIHNQAINEMGAQGIEDREPYGVRINQTTEILWSLQESNPGTLGAELGAAQSVVMMDTWNDSLLIARARQIDPGTMNYALVVEVARRSLTRNEGSEAAANLMVELRDKAEQADVIDMITSELILAYRDDNKAEEALVEARKLKETTSDSTWVAWADRAIYDLENLMPGMAAPAFDLVDWEGNAISMDSYTDKLLIIEFFAPGPDFDRQLVARNAFLASSEEAPFEMLSISIESDSLMNEAFFGSRDIPGTLASLPEGPDATILKDYNVLVLPTRFVINEGKIVGKYVLENGARAFQEALTLYLQSE